MNEIVDLHYVLNALIFSAIGLIIFGIGFALLDVMTPKVSIWKERVEKQNVAVAIFLASAIIGIAVIIASAIHG